jgi:hypothetical protein
VDQARVDGVGAAGVDDGTGWRWFGRGTGCPAAGEREEQPGGQSGDQQRDAGGGG